MHKCKPSWLCPKELQRTRGIYRSKWLVEDAQAWPQLQQHWCGWCQERLGSWGFASSLPVTGPAKPQALLTFPPSFLLHVRLTNTKETAEKCSPHTDAPKPAACQALANSHLSQPNVLPRHFSENTSTLQVQTRCSQSEAFLEGCVCSSLYVRIRDSPALS